MLGPQASSPSGVEHWPPEYPYYLHTNAAGGDSCGPSTAVPQTFSSPLKGNLFRSIQ